MEPDGPNFDGNKYVLPQDPSLRGTATRRLWSSGGRSLETIYISQNAPDFHRILQLHMNPTTCYIFLEKEQHELS